MLYKPCLPVGERSLRPRFILYQAVALSLCKCSVCPIFELGMGFDETSTGSYYCFYVGDAATNRQIALDDPY
jgi:hypothetical protein